MQQRHVRAGNKEHLFTASEVAEFEYCPLVWWFEQYEPAAHADKEELFARLVELEEENGTEAPALPEYQMIEQLLLRQGAFDEGREQHLEHAEAVEAIVEERLPTGKVRANARLIAIVALVILVLAVLLIGIAIVLR